MMKITRRKNGSVKRVTFPEMVNGVSYIDTTFTMFYAPDVLESVEQVWRSVEDRVALKDVVEQCVACVKSFEIRDERDKRDVEDALARAARLN